MRTRGKALAFLATAVLGLVPATAAQAEKAPTGPFQAQAEAAGLTRAEQQQLQRQVDQVLAARGGTQVAANQVRWADGKGDTMLPLPGEKRVRDLSQNGQVGTQGDVSTCKYGYLCIYDHTGYDGAQESYYYCHRQSIWMDFNSYVNNQTAHTVAEFYDAPGQLYHRTPGAWSSAWNYHDGYVIHSIDPC